MDRQWTSGSMRYISPREGAGTDAWREEAEAQGGVGTQKLLEVTEVIPSDQVLAALGLGKGETAVVRRRVMYLDGHPVELTDSYYPAAAVRGTPLAEGLKIRGGAVQALADLGFVACHVIEDIESRPPTDAETSALELRPGDWVLTLFRTSLTTDRRPMEAAIMTVPARHHRLRYELGGV
ncbi:GntR family transcriptional regulator [Streptacidiphilus sp. N1-12]|uniref:GntR family transcriptional regulator n=1 Tax=Streptacidiphilus alkalitolerans TaxID=3342712 RepID=A0ABV6WRC7_9ACTN